MTKKSRSSKKPAPLAFRFAPQSADLPATQGTLQLVRTELKSEMRAGFSQMNSRFAQADSQFAQMDSKFAQMDSKFEQVLSEVARVGTLVEEQNSRNRVVLEGLTSLWQRQERVESRMDETEQMVRSIVRSRT